MNKSELRALLLAYFRLLAEVRDKDTRRRRSFLNYASFLTIWVVLGLFVLAVTYGPIIDIQRWVKQNLHVNLSPGYFPVVALVVWAGVIGSTTSILIKFINFNPLEDNSLTETESALRSGPAAVVVGAVLSLVAFCAFSSGAIRGDLFPDFISNRTVSARMMTPQVEPGKINKPVQQAQAISADSNNAPTSGKEEKPQGTGASNAPQPVNEIQEKRIEVLRQDTLTEAERFRKNLDGESYYLFQIMRELMPSSPRSLALLLFWCFVAGYSQNWLLNWIKKLSEKNS